MKKVTRLAPDEVKGVMLDAEKLDINIKQLNDQLASCKKHIKTAMYDEGVTKYIVDDIPEGQYLQAQIYEQSSVKYDIDAIKGALTKEQLQLVMQSVLVVEEEGLRKFIQKHPEFRQELRSFIHKSSIIDERKLGLAIEQGIVTLDDLKGCYSIETKDIFRLQRVQRFDMV